MNKKGFTLIELLAVLVVLAILALISIPITIRIINNSRTNSYKRSIAAYGRSVENAVGQYLTDNPNTEYQNIDLSTISDYIKYSGNSVTCKRLTIKSNSDIKLEGCQVNNSVQYKYENRKVEQADIEYRVGDMVKVSGIDFYVMSNKSSDDYLVALKAEPLTADEINNYGGVGTDNSYVNRYTQEFQGAAYSGSKYGGMTFYSSETCGYVNGAFVTSGCLYDYKYSDVKHVVDGWVVEQIGESKLKDIKVWNGQYWYGYKARLIQFDFYDEFYNSLDEFEQLKQYSWLYDCETFCWSMSSYGTSQKYILPGGGWNCNAIYYMPKGNVRPVINVYKKSID